MKKIVKYLTFMFSNFVIFGLGPLIMFLTDFLFLFYSKTHKGKLQTKHAKYNKFMQINGLF